VYTYGAWGVDIDGDGDQDLLINDHGTPTSGLYVNDGSGGLTKRPDVFKYPTGTKLHFDRHDCDTADVDGNGRLDIYCTGGSHQGTATKVYPYETNELWLQQLDGTFVNDASAWGVTEPTSRGREVAFVNANGDTWPDLVTTADRRTDGQRSETVLYLNDHGTRFVDTGGPGGLTRYGPVRCLEKADWNRDGFTDLAMCPYQGGVRLFQGTGTGTFKDVTTQLGAGATNTMTWSVAFADVTGDGAADLIRVNTTSLSIRPWSSATGQFTNGASYPETDAKDLAVGRYDDNGTVDIYVLNAGCASCDPVNPSDSIYLGKGDGTFTKWQSVDSTGIGDFVSTWDPTGSGRISWVVGNGPSPNAGPLERFTWTPGKPATTTTTSTTSTTTTESTTTGSSTTTTDSATTTEPTTTTDSTTTTTEPTTTTDSTTTTTAALR
jgi:hypothetical protein